MRIETLELLQCDHCGEACDDSIQVDEKVFCCQGCKAVFEILSENDLCEYYSLDERAGLSQKNIVDNTYDYLDEHSIRRKLLTFDSSALAKVEFSIPAIHCVSCIWLLENLRRINKGILKAEVTFGRKTITIDFDPGIVKLSAIASLLTSLGYPPVINPDADKQKTNNDDQSLVFRLAVAGFCFGNVMLFSFPEYLGINRHDENLMHLFSWLNIVLALPVFLYSAAGYFTSAWKSFQQRQINIDLPIAAGLVALFSRSAFDIFTQSGPSYLDSFTGLVFFLLIGRWFQNKTYESLSFDRDFRSYFPLAVNRNIDGTWKPAVIYELVKGDHIRIRNMEIVPADSILTDAHAYFDYSFVTGEAKPVKAFKGDLIYAGGRLIGQPVELAVEKETSQSHLTSLWNNHAFKKINESGYRKIIDRAAQRFTWVVIALALATACFWYYYRPDQMWLVLTSVLMVACPCALALAAPFTYGTMLRAFGEHGFYLKNADVIERLGAVDAVVFDKTGTILYGNISEVRFVGVLSEDERAAVKLLTGSSTHPLSNLISKSLECHAQGSAVDFKEIPGKGIQAVVSGRQYKLGSGKFINFFDAALSDYARVFLSIDDKYRGYFTIRIKVRENIGQMLQRLGNKCVALLSGDGDADRARMESLFNSSAALLFDQDPHAKLAFIKALQNKGRKVLMVGDGLNDAGALKQSDVGIAVSDDTGVFTPACDGILSGSKLVVLDTFMDLARTSSMILKTAFVISFFYNAVALTFAITGHLTPLVAAVLMPVSSISVVGFSTIAVNFIVRKKLDK